MPTDFAFRLSTYLTLFLSCVALGYAEWDLLPEAAVFTFVVAGLLGVAFHREDKLEMSLIAANRLGMVIGIVAFVWLAFQIVRPSGGLIYKLPWPASMLPYLGPLVMILMPAKLFRPKHVGDWWTMHGVGLAAVALGCALAEDLAFGILAAGYLICGTWSLSLFFLRRAAGTMPAIPGRPATEPRAIVVTGEISTAPKTRLGRAFAARPLWALAAAAAIGAGLFLVTPRIDGPRWSLTQSREVGLAGEDSAPDLTRGGSLNGTNKEIAFEVYVRNADGTPKEDVPYDQRWRVRPFFDYDAGKWRPNTPLRTMFASGVKGPGRVEEGNAPAPPKPHAPRPGEATYEFVWKARRKDAVLADPVMWSRDRPSPVLSGNQPWAQLPDGSFLPYKRDAFGRYVQLNRPSDEPDLGPLFELTNWNGRLGPVAAPSGATPFAGFEVLLTTRLSSVRDIARNLLARLVAEGKLPAGVTARLDAAARTVAIEDHELVARAISNFVANSGEYEYSLSTPTPPKGIDPIEDFLTKSKSGSCERFATAVVQLLRGLGVPCKMVIGFKGCEAEGDGKYVVRQESAHAWVEVLVRRVAPAGFVAAKPIDARGEILADPEVRPFDARKLESMAPGVAAPNPDEPLPPPPFLYAWLALDPTPGDGSIGIEDASLAGSVRSVWASVADWFSSLVVEYNPESRERVAAAIGDAVRRWWLPAVVAVALAVAAFVLFRAARRAVLRRKAVVRPASSVPAWYQRFSAVAAERGFARLAAETPVEHAARFAASLPADLASWPKLVAELFATVRYGGQPADPASVAAVDAGLARLASK